MCQTGGPDEGTVGTKSVTETDHSGRFLGSFLIGGGDLGGVLRIARLANCLVEDGRDHAIHGIVADSGEEEEQFKGADEPPEIAADTSLTRDGVSSCESGEYQSDKDREGGAGRVELTQRKDREDAMAKPIALEIAPRETKAELAEKLQEAPSEHAEALLAGLKVLQALHDRGMLELLQALWREATRPLLRLRTS